MRLSPEAVRLGRRLKYHLHTPEGLALLKPRSRRTWTSGGCTVLALALREVTGGELWGVFDYLPRRQAVAWGHMVCMYVGESTIWFLDGDGVSTSRQLVRRWRTEHHFQHPILHPAGPQWPKQLLANERLRQQVAPLAAYLRERMPPETLKL